MLFGKLLGTYISFPGFHQKYGSIIIQCVEKISHPPNRSATPNPWSCSCTPPAFPGCWLPRSSWGPGCVHRDLPRHSCKGCGCLAFGVNGRKLPQITRSKICSPPARWGLLDSFSSTSASTSTSTSALPTLCQSLRQLPCAVGTAGPQLPASDLSGHGWTSTATFWAQWAPLDLSQGPF